MKNKVTLIVSSVGIGALYLIAKVLIIQRLDKNPSVGWIYTGAICAIIACIWATLRFAIFRKSVKLAIAELIGGSAYVYILFHPIIEKSEKSHVHMVTPWIIGGLIAGFIYLLIMFIKNKQLSKRYENSITFAFLASGACMLLGSKVLSFIFSGIGYYLTGEYEQTNKNPDKYYAKFCYASIGFSIIMAFI